MRKQLVLTMIIAASFASPAQALSIKNRSGIQQSLVLEQGGHRQAITLEPNESRYLVGGDMMLTMPGQAPKQVKFEEEYVIWPDGKMIIQKRQKVKGGVR